jgi:hypothetical protein
MTGKEIGDGRHDGSGSTDLWLVETSWGYTDTPKDLSSSAVSRSDSLVQCLHPIESAFRTSLYQSNNDHASQRRPLPDVAINVTVFASLQHTSTSCKRTLFTFDIAMKFF